MILQIVWYIKSIQNVRSKSYIQSFGMLQVNLSKLRTNLG